MAQTDAQKYAEALRIAFFHQAKKVIVNTLVSWLPFLGGSFFSPIFGFIASKIATGLATDGKLLVYFQYIDMRVDAQAKGYGQAAIEYHNALESGDENEIKRTEKILDAKFDAFVSWKPV